MKLETVGVVLLFLFFLVGAAVAAWFTFASFGPPSPYSWHQFAPP